MPVCEYLEARNQPGCLLYYSLGPYFLKYGLSLKLDLANRLDWLARKFLDPSASAPNNRRLWMYMLSFQGKS